MDYKKLLLTKINSQKAVIGIIGLGYVGLPLALVFAEKGFDVIGFDTDKKKIPILEKGETYIKHIPSSRIQTQVSNGKLKATFDFSLLTSCDCIIICVPTPLNEHREPDMSFIENSAKVVAQYLQPGQLITLESSTYPGTTEEILLPLFEAALSHITKGGDTEGGSCVGSSFFLAFSPEREDPNNPDYSTSTIPKVVGGMTKNCLELACALYDKVIKPARSNDSGGGTVPVSSPRTAEATKLLENIYRSVNIALVNELKMVFDRMNIDVWEVIEAAKTKPFGYHPFYPGPGLGGHCIPIDPFYLTWKAREYDISTKFIELAGEINTLQPYYVVQKAIEVLNNFQLSILNSKILIIGASYKKNIDDMRESPTLKLIEIFREKGALVDYFDPYVPKLPKTRKYNFEMESIPESSLVSCLPSYNLVLISTDHDLIDYSLIADHSSLILDTRNVFERKRIKPDKVFKA